MYVGGLGENMKRNTTLEQQRSLKCLKINIWLFQGVSMQFFSIQNYKFLYPKMSILYSPVNTSQMQYTGNALSYVIFLTNKRRKINV